MTTKSSDPRAQIPPGSPEWDYRWVSLKRIPKQLREQMPDDYWKEVIKGTPLGPLLDSEFTRELYWQREDERERIKATPLANVTRAEFEAMIERILWRVLHRAATAVWRFALLVIVLMLIYTFFSRLLR